MARRRTVDRDPLPSDAELARTITLLVRDALRVVHPYRRLYQAGLERGRRGDGIPTTGGDEANVPLQMVLSPAAERDRRRARYIAREVRTAATALDNARSALERYVEGGYEQPAHDRARSVVPSAEFAAALERQADRKARGVE